MIEILKKTFAEWQEDRVSILAAALAYYTVFSVAPLLILVIAGLTFLGQGGAQSSIVQWISATVGSGVGDLIGTMIEDRRVQGGNVVATIVGVGILLVGATGVFAQLQKALDIIWGVEPGPGKGGIGRLVRVRIAGLGMVLTVGLLLLISLVLSAVISGLAASAADAVPGSGLLWGLLDWLVSIVVITLLIAMIFKYLPDVRVPWRSLWVGALVTALSFVLGKWLLGLYLSRAGVASAYGAAGSLVVLLLWVFYSAQIVLIGAEFTQVHARRNGAGIEPDEGTVPTKGL